MLLIWLFTTVRLLTPIRFQVFIRLDDDVLIRDAEVMRHLGPVQAAVAPETSRPGVLARIPSRIVQRRSVVERGPEVRGPAIDAGPGSSETADRAAVESAIASAPPCAVRRHAARRNVRRGEMRGRRSAARRSRRRGTAAVKTAAEAAAGVGVAMARRGPSRP